MNKKLSVSMEDLEELFDSKLKPIKDDISSLKTDMATIKDVVENKVYKQLKETRKEMKEGFTRVDETLHAIVLDQNEFDGRVTRLEKRTSSHNN